jgi:hypothetical protein
MVDDTIDMRPSPAADVPALNTPRDGENDDVDPSRAALVTEWVKRVQKARGHWKDVFKRMEFCQQIATEGAEEPWLKGDLYVVPIVKRHIDQMVAVLYAKNPKATAQRRKRMMYKLWDGKPESVEAAVQAVQPPPPAPVAGLDGQPLVDPATGGPLMAPPPFEPDPNALALLAEIQSSVEYDTMVDRMAKTSEILFEYFTSEQAAGFKSQMKALVRRTKVNGVGWSKLCFQRELEKRPEISAQIDDTTSQISSLEQLSREVAEGETDDQSPKIEELRLLLRQLQDQEAIVVREGPVWDWPRSNEIIVDTKCRHLKTLAGARWVAHEFMLTPCEIEEIYGVDVGERFTKFEPEGSKENGSPESLCRVFEIQDKKNGQFLTVCEGYPDFLKEPAEPDVRIERFFTLFALVFNETERHDNPFPPSDVWVMRHLQAEYNRSREALREHRIAAAPQYLTKKGSMDEKDRAALSGAAPHSVIEVKTGPGEDPADLVKRMDKVGIDPNLYEVNQVYSDIQRVSGSQEANLGGTSQGTATESSIAENSRGVSISENVDDLDEFLTDMARSVGHLMLMELSRETVLEIAGPGAVWPDIAGNREEIAKDLALVIKAGSSGKPNAAAELANIERAAPYLMQLPGFNPRPLTRKYVDLLDLDFDESYIEGLPSITALNAAAGNPGQTTGNPATDPMAQGGKGAQNAPSPVVNEPGAQPAYPAPMA